MSRSSLASVFEIVGVKMEKVLRRGRYFFSRVTSSVGFLMTQSSNFSFEIFEKILYLKKLSTLLLRRVLMMQREFMALGKVLDSDIFSLYESRN